jgi:hypothetical protein
MIQGGWSFVAWAYGISYGGLVGYGLLLWYRVERPLPGDKEDLS